MVVCRNFKEKQTCLHIFSLPIWHDVLMRVRSRYSLYFQTCPFQDVLHDVQCLRQPLYLVLLHDALFDQSFICHIIFQCRCRHWTKKCLPIRGFQEGLEIFFFFKHQEMYSPVKQSWLLFSNFVINFKLKPRISYLPRKQIQDAVSEFRINLKFRWSDFTSSWAAWKLSYMIDFAWRTSKPN